MKKILLLLILSFPFVLQAQNVYSYIEEPICWTINGVDSSLTRIYLVSDRTPDQRLLLYTLNADFNAVTVTTDSISFGWCDCCGGGSGGDISPWKDAAGNNTNDASIYVQRSGDVSIGVNDNSHTLRMDGDFQFQFPNNTGIFDWRENSSSDWDRTGLLLQDNGEINNFPFTGRNVFGLAANNASIFDRTILGGLLFAGTDPVGGDLSTTAGILAQADGNWATGDLATQLNFFITKDGESLPTNTFTLQSDGRLELDEYTNFNDGVPNSMVWYEDTDKDLFKTDIAGTPSSGDVIKVDGAGTGLEWGSDLLILNVVNELPTTATNGDIAYIKGYYSINDGGGGFFKWESNRSKAEANAGSIFDPSTKNSWDGTQGNISTLINAQGTGTGNGVWVRIGNEVSTAQFGLVNNQLIDQFAALKNAIERTTTNFNLVFDTLYYALVTSSIEIPKRVKIKSKHPKKAGILIDTTSSPNSKFILLVNDSVNIEGLRIECPFQAVQNNQISFIVGKGQSDVKDLIIDNCSFEGLGCTFVRVNGENLQIKNTDHLNAVYGSYHTFLRNPYFYNNHYRCTFSSNVIGEGVKTVYGRGVTGLIMDRCKADSLGRDLLDTTGGMLGGSITNSILNYCQQGEGGLDLKKNYNENVSIENDSLLNRNINITDCVFTNSRIVITNSFTGNSNTADSLFTERLSSNIKIASSFINCDRPIFVKRGLNISVDGSNFHNCSGIFYSSSDAESAFTGNQAILKRISSNYSFINNQIYQDTAFTGDTGGQFYNARQITISGNSFKLSGEASLLFSIDSINYANIKNNDISINKLKGSQNLDLFRIKNLNHLTISDNTAISDSLYNLVDFANMVGTNNKVKFINNTIEGFANMLRVLSGSVDTVWNINNDLLNTNEFQNLTISDIYYKTDKPQIQNYSGTGSTQVINLQPDGGTIELDLSSYDASLTLTVNRAVQGRFYLFRIFGADQDVVFPSTFKELDGTTNLGTISNNGTTSIPCYFDGTNFICKN